MATEQLVMYRQYASFIKRMVFCSGLWPVTKTESSYFYRQLPILTIFSGTFMCYGGITFCIENLDNIKVFTKGLSPLGGFALVVVKVMMFFLYREQLRELNYHLESMFEEILENIHYRPAVFSLLNFFRRPAYMIYYLMVFTVLSYICRAFLLIIYQIVKNIDPKYYPLPYPAIFPWLDGSFNFTYQIQFLFEIQFGWFMVFVTSGVDTAYGFYIFQMVGILRGMSLECEKVGKSSDEFDIILLRNCIKKEILLLRCRDIIQNVYGPVVLNLIVSSVIVLCGLIFQMFQTEISIEKVVMVVLYGLLKMTQAFIYSWYGNILAVESEAFRRNVYCCGWYEDGNIELMKNVLFILAQKPIVLTACHFFHISLDLFLKILNTSLSYYFLLQTIDETYN